MTSELKELVTRLTADYKKRGLYTNTYSDKPNEVSAPHAHGGATLVTLEGSAEIRLDNDKWQTVTPGDITIIKDDQLHEVRAGNGGWRYLFACSQQEARRQGLLGARPNKKAQSILDRINYVTLATVNSGGQPWNSPVYCAYDQDYNVYWGSHVDSQHSQNIHANGKAFIVVYDSTVAPGHGEGVYMQVSCAEIIDTDEIAAAHKLIQDRRSSQYWKLEEVQTDKPVHLFKATPQKIWMNGDGEKNGQYIDVRVEAEV